MLTIFSIPKAFRGHFGLIQRNAIKSWCLLKPSAQIILFGNDEGVREVAKEFGVQHVPDIAVNEYGTPLLDDAFRRAEQLAEHPLMCYSNTDVIFRSDLQEALREVTPRFPKFLFFSQRWDVPITEPFDFDNVNWEEELKQWAIKVRPPGNLWGLADYFVFPKGAITEMPPFAIGRTGFDNWILYRARRLRLPVINATERLYVIHQKHDYSHHPGNAAWIWKGAEAQRNRQLAGEPEVWEFSIYDVTHLMDFHGIRKAKGSQYLWRRVLTSPTLYPPLNPLKWVFRAARGGDRFIRRIPNGARKISKMFDSQRVANLNSVPEEDLSTKKKASARVAGGQRKDR